MEGGNNDRDIYLTILFDVSWEFWRCDCQAYSRWCLSLSPASMWVFCRRQGGYNSWDACLSTAIYSQLHQIILSIFVPCSSSFFLLFSLSLNIWGGSPVAESTASGCNNLIRLRSYTYLGHFLQPDYFSSVLAMPYFCWLFVSSHYF